MRVGVVSDTHNHLANVASLVALFNAAAVDRGVHTGDVTQAKTLNAFAALDAPLCGVYGNNDVEREALDAACREHGYRWSEPGLELDWAGRRIVVVHDPRDVDGRAADYDLLLHGHTHRHVLERNGEVLTFNPGECAGHMSGYNAVGVVDLATMDVELLKF